MKSNGFCCDDVRHWFFCLMFFIVGKAMALLNGIWSLLMVKRALGIKGLCFSKEGLYFFVIFE